MINLCLQVRKPRLVPLLDFSRIINSNKMSTDELASTKNLLHTARKVVPHFASNRHKGQAGRIGVIGGSLEYTGAPYFAGISALRVGADLVHIFCQNAAAPVIKSYSPELIVHPILDSKNAVHEILQWAERLHVLVIGPGLGRDERVLQTTANLIEIFQKNNKPIVIDADGLHIITKNKNLLKSNSKTVLTPNAIEYARMFGDKPENMSNPHTMGITILKKGESDCIYNSGNGEVIICPPGGSGRRCGGQGDLLSGALAIFLHWALESNEENAAVVASFAASFLTKSCNSKAFEKFGRSALATDMINEIHSVFEEHFEHN